MTQYLLDTNTVSHIVRGHAKVLARMQRFPMESLCISVVTEAEMMYGLAKRPEAVKLHKIVEAFLIRVTVLPWERKTARVYGTLRAQLEAKGKSLSPVDLFIGAHALSVDAVLVSNDGAFSQVSKLRLQDWTK
jgi:tRNA(fMet)-specific endonuclease VapC